jgi:hypothetical protein
MDLLDAFHAEIHFWQEMLNAQTEQTDPDVLERMQMAKLLAEQKLTLYTSQCLQRVN